MWVKGRIENRIRFGPIAERHVLDPSRQFGSFEPGPSFIGPRTIPAPFSRIDILRAVREGERYWTVPGVRPRGEILLHLAGWRKVVRVLEAIDIVEALGIDPADAAPEHWRHVHSCLFVNEKPRPYTPTRHRAWLWNRNIAG